MKNTSRRHPPPPQPSANGEAPDRLDEDLDKEEIERSRKRVKRARKFGPGCIIHSYDRSERLLKVRRVLEGGSLKVVDLKTRKVFCIPADEVGLIHYVKQHPQVEGDDDCWDYDRERQYHEEKLLKGTGWGYWSIPLGLREVLPAKERHILELVLYTAFWKIGGFGKEKLMAQNGWVYLGVKYAQKETGLGRHAQGKAIDGLVKRGFLWKETIRVWAKIKGERKRVQRRFVKLRLGNIYQAIPEKAETGSPRN